MVNPKAIKISSEQKEEIKEIVKEKKGTVIIGAVSLESLEVAEKIRKSKIPYFAIKEALENGQAYEFEGTRNGIFNISQTIKEKYQIETVFVKLKSGHFAIYKKKE